MNEDNSSFAALMAALIPDALPDDGFTSRPSSPQAFRSTLVEAGLVACEDAAAIADTSTSGSLSSMTTTTPEQTAPRDEFAARLTAAFVSGALDMRARPSVVTLGPRARLAESVARRDDAPRSHKMRVNYSVEQDGRRQKYASTASTARSLYSPW